MFHRFGAEVTIVQRSEQLLAHGYEPEVGQAIGEVFEKEGIKVITRASARSVRQDGKGVIVSVETGGQTRELRAEKLIVATGRRPNSDKIAIERAGVELAKEGHIRVDEFLRTNVPHIFAGGDVIGREVSSQMATPVGSQDGGIAAHNAFADGEPRRVSHRVIPRTIFTDPQIAIVGMTEEEAISAGHNCWCNTVPMSLVPPRRRNPRHSRHNQDGRRCRNRRSAVLRWSVIPLEKSSTRRPLGCVSTRRSDFIELLHVYPTMAEALKIIAISRRKDPAKLPCCAE